MVGQNQIFIEGASINRLPSFVNENYPFWKVRMQSFWNLLIGVFRMLW